MNALAMTFGEAADRVKQSIDIVDIIQRHVVLRKSGRNYSGLCPFHNDKNPSMNVSREKNLFKCFSCGVGGDALGFLMRLENKTYGETIRELADEQGITILSDGKSPQEAAEAAAKTKDEKQAILSLSNRSQQWFHNQLRTSLEAEPVRQYLLNRGIDEAAIHQFGFGYAPQGWDHLTQYLKNNEALVKEDQNLLVTAGLASPKQENAGFYDRFRHRLMIPIHDDRGQIVAFGGRALSPEEKAKYLNSPETAIYHKSRILYGLHLAKEAIRQSKSAVVMEGYFDVIAAHQAGVSQAVGSCGTAMTEQQVKLLTRFGAETIYLAFDADEAGQKAALSAITLIEPYLGRQQGLSVKILRLPQDSPFKDPDEYIRATGGPAFLDLFAHATPFLDFKFDQAILGLDMKTSAGRVEASQRLLPLLSAITQPILRAEMLSRYSQRIGVSEEALMMEVRQFGHRFNQTTKRHMEAFAHKKPWGRKPAKPILSDNVSQLRSTLLPSHLVAERNLLRLVLAHPQSLARLLPIMGQRQLKQPALQQIYGLMRESLEEFEPDELTSKVFIEFVTDALHDSTPGPASDQAMSEFAELVMSADNYARQLKLTDKTPSNLWMATLEREACLLCQRLDAYERQQALKQLVKSQNPAQNTVRSSPLLSASEDVESVTAEADLELLEIERQYQLFEQLKQQRERSLNLKNNF
ncbi:MAG: DNA primase [Vampirovibrionales bacterium]|nr:DNA primase [Vampirovibrionales bacterium]